VTSGTGVREVVMGGVSRWAGGRSGPEAARKKETRESLGTRRMGEVRER